jgi:hypothetical protein
MSYVGTKEKAEGNFYVTTQLRALSPFFPARKHQRSSPSESGSADAATSGSTRPLWVLRKRMTEQYSGSVFQECVPE